MRSDQNPSSGNTPNSGLVQTIDTESDPIPKGILVVHGMGSPPKGGAIYQWVNPIIEHMRAKLGNEPKVTTSLEEEPSKVPSNVTLDIDAGNGSKQTWVFAEVWWAKAFPTAKFDIALSWTLFSMVIHLCSFASGLLQSVTRATGSLLLYFELIPKAAYNEARHLSKWGGDDEQYVDRKNEIAKSYSGRLGDSRLRMARGPDHTDEKSILDGLGRENLTDRQRLRMSALYICINLFHIFNAAMMVALMGLIIVLLIPTAILLTGLNLVSGFPGVPAVVRGIKKGMDAFLLGSLGDIQVFLEEPVQANQIRTKVEDALEFLYKKGCGEINIIAHSTGVPICYEVLNERPAHGELVSRFFSVGSIMRLAWQSKDSRRQGLTKVLSTGHEKFQWFNFWAKYDLAHPGPVQGEYSKITGEPNPPVRDISVTKENSLLRDHVTYESNDEQVVSRIVAEIWGDSAEEPFRFNGAQSAANDRSRIARIWWLAFPRLMLLYTLPAALIYFSLSMENARAWARNVIGLAWNDWAKTHLAQRIEPDAWEKALAVVVATALLMVGGYIAYVAYKNFLWEWLVRRGKRSATPKNAA